MARIRMISVGSRGDLQPYLAILLELQRRGHQVSLIGSVNFQAVAEAHGLPFVPLPGDFTSLLRSEAGLALMQGKPMRLIADGLLTELLTTAHAAMEATDLLLAAPWWCSAPCRSWPPVTSPSWAFPPHQPAGVPTAPVGVCGAASTAAATGW
jgi:UDP:flavonoid glycosyltransferase YjiC (YdhE family)